MYRHRTLFALTALALGALLLNPDVSSAQFRFGRGGGGFGGYGSGYGGYGGGYGGYGGGYGLYGNNWGLSIGQPAYGGYGYNNMGYGSTMYGNYGWNQPYYGSNYVTPGYNYGYTQPYAYQQPYYGGNNTIMQTGGYDSFYPSGGTTMQAQRDSSRAYIHVRVPANAQVFFDNQPTQQQGPDRTFMTPQLEGNHNYTYEISARWMDNGQERRENRTVRLTPGQTADVDFTGSRGDGQSQQNPNVRPPQSQQNPSQQQNPSAPPRTNPPDR